VIVSMHRSDSNVHVESESLEVFSRSAPPSRASSSSSTPSEAEYVSKIEENGNRSLKWSVLLNVIFVICFATFSWVLIAKFDEANLHRSESNLLKEELKKEKEKIDILLNMEKSHEREKVEFQRFQDQKLENIRFLVSKMAEKDLQIEELEKRKKEIEEKMYEDKKRLNDEISLKDKMIEEKSRENEIETFELKKQILEINQVNQQIIQVNQPLRMKELASKRNAPIPSSVLSPRNLESLQTENERPTPEARSSRLSKTHSFSSNAPTEPEVLPRISKTHSFSSNASTEPDIHIASIEIETPGRINRLLSLPLSPDYFGSI